MSKGPTIKMKKSMIFVLCVIVFVGYTSVLLRLLFLQVLANDKYQKLAIDQQLRDATITAPRGTIYDTNMKAMAKSATVWNVNIAPKEISTDEKRELVAQGLSDILGVDKDFVLEKTKKNNYYEIIKKKVEKPEVDKIREYIAEKKVSGIHISENSKRYYPYGEFAASILGFTGTDGQGLGGVEAYYEKYLKGIDGRMVTATNAKGTEMPFEYTKLYEPQPGNDIVLTIDENVQHYLEKHLSYAVKEHNVTNKGAGIVMNVKTGEILAMSTKPDFDPNNPFLITDEEKKKVLDTLEGEERKEYLAKEQQSQWRNKLVSDLYEPGSVFKVVTAAAGLEEGVITEKSNFNCKGHLTISGIVIKCNKTEGHGPQNFSDGFKNSCNPVFMETAEKLGKDNFFKYLEGFGLTKKTGIDLPGEEQSVYYTPNKTGVVELASQSFGQSNKFTPIQIATAVATAVNGGRLVQPHIVKKIIDKDGNVVSSFDTTNKRQVISEDVSKKIVSMMERVVSESAGSKNAKIAGYRIGGKSGTSQKLDGDDDARIASFVAVAPVEDPEILTLIILDEPHSYSPYGSVLSAPVAGNVLSDILEYLNIMPQYTEEELKNQSIVIPSLIEKKVSQATEELRKIGLKTKTIGSGNVIRSQFPPSGHKVSINSTVVLYTDSDEVKNVAVPDLSNMTLDQATRELNNKGLNIQVEGNYNNSSKSLVYKQSTSPGEMVPVGSVIKVTFTNRNSIE